MMSQGHIVSSPDPELATVHVAPPRERINFLMGYHHNTVIAKLASIHSELKTNSSELTLSDVLQTKEKLESIILELQSIHNSKLAVNRLVPCLLYNIFAFAAYDPSSIPGPEMTALRISHVCRCWRDFALEWPVLWAFVNPVRPPPIVELFLNRSGNSALTMTCQVPLYASEGLSYSRIPASFKYLESRNKSILPRLWSLTLRFRTSQFNLIRRVLNASRTPSLLSLRYLDICFDRFKHTGLPSLKDLFQLDVSPLRGFSLSGINWPWFEYPHPSLTYIKLHHPPELPSLSTFLTFLSSCPLLRELEYHIDGERIMGLVYVSTSPTSASDDRLLYLPNLERFILKSNGLQSCNYIRGISEHVGPSRCLSQFQLICEDWISSSRNVFDSVPSGIFSHFSDHSYLSIDANGKGRFDIMSASKRDPSFDSPPNLPLRIAGLAPSENLPVEELPIFRLICEVPRIVHPTLIGHAWKILTSPKFCDWFPCLQFLEMKWTSFGKGETFNTPPDAPKIGTLIIDRDAEIPLEILPDMIHWIGAKSLRLDEGYLYQHRRDPEFGKFIAALQGIAVKTSVVNWKGEDKCISWFKSFENPYPTQGTTRLN